MSQASMLLGISNILGHGLRQSLSSDLKRAALQEFEDAIRARHQDCLAGPLLKSLIKYKLDYLWDQLNILTEAYENIEGFESQSDEAQQIKVTNMQQLERQIKTNVRSLCKILADCNRLDRDSSQDVVVHAERIERKMRRALAQHETLKFLLQEVTREESLRS